MSAFYARRTVVKRRRSLYFLGLVAALGVFVAGCHTAPHCGDAPWHDGAAVFHLRNQHLTAKVMHPGWENAWYRGVRFERSGMILCVTTAGGHTFFGPIVPPAEHDANAHDHVAGTAEEFDMHHPPGYADAAPGDGFIKIGVGVLRRPDHAPYQFWRRYEVLDHGQWRYEAEPHQITSTHQLNAPDGWAYRYTKTVELGPGVGLIRIKRRLTNTGSRPITTEHYGHNFTIINERPIGPGYRLRFPFLARPGSAWKDPGFTTFEGHDLVFTATPKGRQQLWGLIDGHDVVQGCGVTIEQTDSGASLTVTQPHEAERFVVYAREPAVSVEMFTKLVVPPGESKQWETEYRFADPPRGILGRVPSLNE